MTINKLFFQIQQETYSNLKKINREDKLFLKSVNLLKKIKKNKKKVIIFGNGGSAATSSHFAVDLTKNARIKCINFNDADLITCFSNDYGFENFVKQGIDSYSNKGDAVILISVSGESKNVINAAKFANEQGAETLCLVGYDGGELKKICKYNVHVPSFDMQICEDIHLMIGHMIMKKLCGSVIN